MELRALGPHAKLVKMISVWNSRGSRMMTLNDLAPCGLHEILLHVMGEVELLFMMTDELDYIRRCLAAGFLCVSDEISAGFEMHVDSM